MKIKAKQNEIRRGKKPGFFHKSNRQRKDRIYRTQEWPCSRIGDDEERKQILETRAQTGEETRNDGRSFSSAAVHTHVFLSLVAPPCAFRETAGSILPQFTLVAASKQWLHLLSAV
jgi:hypothetical protein